MTALEKHDAYQKVVDWTRIAEEMEKAAAIVRSAANSVLSAHIMGICERSLWQRAEQALSAVEHIRYESLCLRYAGVCALSKEGGEGEGSGGNG